MADQFPRVFRGSTSWVRHDRTTVFVCLCNVIPSWTADFFLVFPVCTVQLNNAIARVYVCVCAYRRMEETKCQANVNLKKNQEPQVPDRFCQTRAVCVLVMGKFNKNPESLPDDSAKIGSDSGR